MTSLLFGKMRGLKTLQLSLPHCTGKLANSGHLVISNVMLTANPLLHSSGCDNAAPLSLFLLYFNILYWGHTQQFYLFFLFSVIDYQSSTVHCRMYFSP